MDKKELVDNLSKKLKVESAVAETAVNETIAEIASPLIFRKPGGEAGLILDNSCSNNCKEPNVKEVTTRPVLDSTRLTK